MCTYALSTEKTTLIHILLSTLVTLFLFLYGSLNKARVQLTETKTQDNSEPYS